MPIAWLQHGKKQFFSLNDFFPLDDLAKRRIGGFDFITMEQYLRVEGLGGNLINQTSSLTMFPPDNRTDWRNCNATDVLPLYDFLRSSAFDPGWRYDDCILGFSKAGLPPNVTHLQGMLDEILQHSNVSYTAAGIPTPINTSAMPTPVNASVLERLKDFTMGQPKFCGYDQDLQQKLTLHLKCCEWQDRMIRYFYSFLFFEDWKEDLWMKRTIRNQGI
jgi:hypothetical protein